MAEYYRTIFTIEESARGLELLEQVANEARKWAGYEFGEPLDDVRGELEGTEGRLRFWMRSVDDSGIFRLVWERPDPHDPELQWRLGLRLATEGDDMEADIEVQGLEWQGGAPPDIFQARPPSLVSTLFNKFHCSLDGERLTTEAHRATNANSFREELLDPKRSVPLLVVSEEKPGDSASEKAGHLQRQLSVEYGRLAVPGTWREKANHLQRQLLGLVKVVSYDHDTAWHISKDLPRPLRCYDGAMRLYSPGCSESDVSQQHPYWLPSDMDKLGPDLMLRMLRDECVIRLPRQGRRRMFSRVRNAIRSEDTKNLESKVEELEYLQSGKDDELLLESLDIDELLELLELPNTYDEDTVSLSKYSAAMKVAKAFKNKADRLTLENEQLRDSDKSPGFIAIPENSASTQPSEMTRKGATPQFSNISEVEEFAHDQLAGLRFLPSAAESAWGVSRAGQFKKTDKLYEVFKRMSECAEKRRKSSLGMGLRQWFEDRQISYARKESEQTGKRYRSERTFFDDATGDGRYMEEHFKLDDSGFELRVHVDWDKDQSEWIVGYVGPHLSTVSDPH